MLAAARIIIILCRFKCSAMIRETHIEECLIPPSPPPTHPHTP
jgi:hypothetical protein